MTFRDKGHFDVNKFNNASKPGFPLSNIFVCDGFDKTWSEMSKQDKQFYQEEVSEKVMLAVKRLS